MDSSLIGATREDLAIPGYGIPNICWAYRTPVSNPKRGKGVGAPYPPTQNCTISDFREARNGSHKATEVPYQGLCEWCFNNGECDGPNRGLSVAVAQLPLSPWN